MYFGSGIGQLSQASKALRLAWDATEHEWRDQVRKDFEKNQIEPILNNSARALRAMDDLRELFTKIHRDLS